MLSSAEQQTVGTALHQVLPALFPSRRTCLFARPVCQGVGVPMGAPLQELAEIFCGGDGWVDLVVVMMS
jgi:autophagy-related protein 5